MYTVPPKEQELIFINIALYNKKSDYIIGHLKKLFCFPNPYPPLPTLKNQMPNPSFKLLFLTVIKPLSKTFKINQSQISSLVSGNLILLSFVIVDFFLSDTIFRFVSFFKQSLSFSEQLSKYFTSTSQNLPRRNSFCSLIIGLCKYLIDNILF